MKLRFRSLQSKQTQKFEVPDDFSIHQLKEFLSNSLSSPSSLRLSLNGKDDLSSPSPDHSLLSIGIASGDLIYYEFSPSGSQERGNVPSNLQDFSFCNRILDVKCKDSSLSCKNQEKKLVVGKGKEIVLDNLSVEGKCEIEDEKLEIEEVSDGGFVDFDTGSDGKRLSEPYFLRKVLCEDMGNDFSDTKLVFLGIHAVFLESGFVGVDSISGLRVDLFDILKEQVSMSFTTSVSYTLPELLSNDNDTETIVLKFQTLGHYVNVYGSLDKSHLGLHKLNIDKSRYVPAIGSFWVTDDGRTRLNEMDSSIAYAEKVIFDFWKFVKDGMALPLMIDLCEKTGLDLPPCLIRLPADLKFRILELLPGQDVAKVACVCKEMKYLSSNNELWKEKCISAFGRRTGAVLFPTSNWKVRFAASWKKTKKRKRGGRRVDRIANLFGVPQPLPRYGLHQLGHPLVLEADQAQRQRRQFAFLAGRLHFQRIQNIGALFNA